MKQNTRLRRVTPVVRTRRGRTGLKITRATLPVATALVLAALALATGATVATAAELLPTTVPALVAGWGVAVGLTFALPLAAVRVAVAVLERRQ